MTVFRIFYRKCFISWQVLHKSFLDIDQARDHEQKIIFLIFLLDFRRTSGLEFLTDAEMDYLKNL